MNPSEREQISSIIEAHLNPKTYDGHACHVCLIGQAVMALTPLDWSAEKDISYREGWVNRFGQLTGIDLDHDNAEGYNVVRAIFIGAAEPPYIKDAELAMQMARSFLGVDRNGNALPDWPSAAVIENIQRLTR